MTGDLRDKVRKFVIRNFLFGEESGLLDTSSLRGEGLLDAGGLAELVRFLESEFALRITAADRTPENFDSVAAIVAFLDRRLFRPEPIFLGLRPWHGEREESPPHRQHR